jgi:hypothetical protein
MLKHAPRSAHPNAYFRLFTCIIKSKKGVVSVSFDLIWTGSAKSRGLSESFADENCYILGYIHWSNPHSEWCSNINVSPFLIVEDPHCLMMNCYHFPHLMWKIQHFTIFGGDNSQNSRLMVNIPNNFPWQRPSFRSPTQSSSTRRWNFRPEWSQGWTFLCSTWDLSGHFSSLLNLKPETWKNRKSSYKNRVVN